MATNSDRRHGDDLPGVLPDTEQDLGVEIDNIVPSYGYQLTPMVGLGGSAGGIRALQQFFVAMPADAGMVFVVVLHLSPTHESTLPSMIARWTAMPVLQARDGQPAEADHIYVIPPGKHLTAVNGHLRLTDITQEKGRRVAVDLFFRSLADTHGPHAAAIVLSGADSDGMMGVKRIKERGGLTIAQDPGESEHDGMLDLPPGIQVFGCDLDEDAIQAARAGVYPDTIAADVSEARLRRFFVREHRGYRVRRELREVVLFATHDLIKDAPFSRLDLVSCRNLLIYLNRGAQERALDIFHFALKPDGLLFLGTSETVEEGSPLFRVVDSRFRLYAKNATERIGLPVPIGPGTLFARQLEQQAALHHGREAAQPVMVTPATFSQAAALVSRVAPPHEQDRTSWSELHFKLIERFGPPSVLIDRDYEIKHISESAGRFLQMSGGAPTTNLLRLVHPALRVDMRALLFRAANGSASAEAVRIPLELEGAQRTVDIGVHPANDLAPDHLLVTFALHGAASGETAEDRAATQAEPMARQLGRELAQTKMQLRDTVEQYEASTEELKASNEELQAMNEELRSATEELETSREELQSINEELTTVNQEARSKVEELGQANSDLSNLMSATAIATLFLDREMRVMRFTDPAAPIFHLIPSDVGRPLAHLQHEIDYPEMAKDAESVLDTLAPVVREVTGAGGVSYLARMMPYRTYDDRIAGVVLSFVDITERERSKRELAEDLAATERLRSISEQFASEENMQTLFDAMVDAAIAITHADAGTVQLLDAEEGVLRLLASRGLPRELTEHFKEIRTDGGAPCEFAIATGKRSFADFEHGTPQTADSDRWHREVGGLRFAQSTPLMSRDGRPIGAISTHYRQRHEATERELRFLDLLARQAADAIERQVAAEILREQMEELQRFNDAAVGRETRMIELKHEVNDLASLLGEPQRYSLDFERDAD